MKAPDTKPPSPHRSSSTPQCPRGSAGQHKRQRGIEAGLPQSDVPLMGHAAAGLNCVIRHMLGRIAMGCIHVAFDGSYSVASVILPY